MRKNKNLWLYIGGRFVSLLGTGIQTIAIPLYILDVTGSGALMGVFSVLTFVPAIITSIFSGIIGDRRNRRNIMIAADLARGVLICFLGILAYKGCFNIYILFIMQIGISIMDSLFNASSAAIMPELIAKDKLIEANSTKSGFDAASTILGPALGGVIYGIWGIKMVFLINGISFITSAVFSSCIIYNRQVIKREKINRKVLLNENSEVLKFIISKRGLFQLFTFAMILNFLMSPMFDVVMPYVLKKKIQFSSQEYGYIMGFYTFGILLGNIAISLYFKKLTLKKLIKVGVSIETVITVMVCILILPKIVVIYGGGTIALFMSISICCTVMGAFNAFANTGISTNLQNLVPDKMRARFFSILGIFAQGAIPIGAVLFGTSLDKIKYFYILIGIAILSTLVSVIFLFNACDEAYETK